MWEGPGRSAATAGGAEKSAPSSPARTSRCFGGPRDSASLAVRELQPRGGGAATAVVVPEFPHPAPRSDCSALRASGIRTPRRPHARGRDTAEWALQRCK